MLSKELDYRQKFILRQCRKAEMYRIVKDCAETLKDRATRNIVLEHHFSITSEGLGIITSMFLGLLDPN
jgi:hypothetical protein